MTGKATRVDVRPLTVEGILRTNRRDRPLLVGYLLGQLLEAAGRLWPEFVPERTALSAYPITLKEEEGPSVPFVPRWRRSRGQSLVEYALILALIAVVAIVVLTALGGQIANFLSTVGQSI